MHDLPASYIVMAVTSLNGASHHGMSMFIVPSDADGLEIVRNIGLGGEPESESSHGYVRYNEVRVPADHLLGAEGDVFAIAKRGSVVDAYITQCGRLGRFERPST